MKHKRFKSLTAQGNITDTHKKASAQICDEVVVKQPIRCSSSRHATWGDNPVTFQVLLLQSTGSTAGAGHMEQQLPDSQRPSPCLRCGTQQTKHVCMLLHSRSPFVLLGWCKSFNVARQQLSKHRPRTHPLFFCFFVLFQTCGRSDAVFFSWSGCVPPLIFAEEILKLDHQQTM